MAIAEGGLFTVVVAHENTRTTQSIVI